MPPTGNDPTKIDVEPVLTTDLADATALATAYLESLPDELAAERIHLTSAEQTPDGYAIFFDAVRDGVSDRWLVGVTLDGDVAGARRLGVAEAYGGRLLRAVSEAFGRWVKKLSDRAR